jgi:enoyl-[acyl-carrier protein] reductase II
MSEAVATQDKTMTAPLLAQRAENARDSNEGGLPPPPNVSPRLAAMWKRGTEFLGCPVAIMAGAMSWVSERHLVAAISNAGGFGVIACGSMSPALLDAEIKATKALTKKPFAVNVITMHPQLMELIDVCQSNNVTHVVFAAGLSPGEAIKKAKSFAKVVCFAPAAPFAKRLIKSGADALTSALYRLRCWPRKSCR